MIDERHSDIPKGILGIISAGAGVGSTYLDQLEIWARIAGGFLGCAVALVTFISIVSNLIRKRKLGLIQETEAEMELCERCRMGTPPPHCPLSPESRPDDCPRKDL